MGSFVEEGMSVIRPPLFDGTNYNYWSSSMRVYVQAVDFRLWRIIADGPLVPTFTKVIKGDSGIDAVQIVPIEDIYTCDLSLLTESETTKITLNAQAINILYQSINEEEFDRIQGCQTAKEIWDCLEVTWNNLNSDDEVEEVANVVCCMVNNDIEVTSHNSTILFDVSDSSDSECSNNDLSEAFHELYNDHKILLSKSINLSKKNKGLVAQIELLQQENEKLIVEQINLKNENLEILELKHCVEKLKIENESLKVPLKRVELGKNTFNELLHHQNEFADRRSLGFESGSTSKTSTEFVDSTVNENSFVKHEKPVLNEKCKNKVFSCTYCQKGNHSSNNCHIRKLCELGTLLPERKKPVWIVKNNPLRTNHQGPKKKWVPLSIH